MDPSQVFLDSQALFLQTELREELHRLFQPARVMSELSRASFGSEK